MNKRFKFNKNLAFILAGLAVFATLFAGLPQTSFAQADSTVVAVYPQHSHTFVLTAEGKLWAWGDNSYGRLGDGTTTNRNVPVELLLEDVAKLYPQSSGHTFALKNDGTLWAWERNHDGRLGAGVDNITSTAPVQILEQVDQVFPHERHSLALKQDGTLWAWGSNSSGQLGSGQGQNGFSPLQVALDQVQTVVPGENNTFALLEDGTLWAWGSNRYGKLGDGTTINRQQPVKILDSIQAVYPCETHTIALGKDGTVWAWGYNWYGQLGSGNNETQTRPAKVPVPNTEKLFVEKYHAFALDSKGTLWAWGSNWYGQLGDGSISDRNNPVEVPMKSIAELYPQEYHTFALKNDGTLWAWGRNWDGRLGDSSNTHMRPAPVKIADHVTEAFVMERHAFALDDEGALFGWGDNNKGRLGTGSDTDLNNPVPINIEGATALYPQDNHTFALKNDGSLWAWGENNKGQLGVGSFEQQLAPVQVLLGSDLPLYTITLTSNPQNAATLTGGGSYRHGESVNIACEAHSGFSFINWTTAEGEEFGSATNLSFLATRDLNLTANFSAHEEKPAPKEEPAKKDKTYTITLAAQPEKGGKVVGGGTFEEGQEIVIAAEANEGFAFVNWTENNQEISKSTILSFKVTANRSLVAHFKALEEEAPAATTFEVTLASEPEEGGSTQGAGIYEENAKVTVTAEPAPGFSFEKWTEVIEQKEVVDEEEVLRQIEVEVSSSASYVFNLERHRTLIAHFAEEVAEEEAFLVEVLASNGVVTAIFDKDLEAAPALEDFNAWFSQAVITEEETGEPEEQEEPEEPEDPGAVTPENSGEESTAEETLWTSLPLVTLDFDEEQPDRVNLSFAPFAAEDQLYAYTVNLAYLEGEKIQSAPFMVGKAAQYILSLTALPPEGGTVAGAGDYLSGTEVTVFAEAEAFYRFAGWYESEELLNSTARYNFIIEDDRELTAHFEILPPALQEVSAENGEVIVIFDRAPEQNPAAGDFELQVQKTVILEDGVEEDTESTAPTGEEEDLFNGEPEWEPLEINTMHWLREEKKALLNFDPFTAQEETISYRVKVNYGGFSETLAEPFVLEGLEKYLVSAVVVPAGSGLVTGTGKFVSGSMATLKASAQEGYLFNGWYENNALLSREESLDLTVTAERTLAAHFEKIAEEPGEADGEDEDLAIEEGEEEAHFFDINLSFSPPEGGTVTGSGTYEKGERALVKAQSKPGYKFYAWTEDEQTVSFDSAYEFSVTGPRNLQALFEVPDPSKSTEGLFSITLASDPETAGTVKGDSLYEKDETVVVEATSKSGFNFAGWLEDGLVVSTEALFSFKAEKDRHLIASFTPLNTGSEAEAAEEEDRALETQAGALPTLPQVKNESPIEENTFYSVTLVTEPETGGLAEGQGLYEENDLIGLNAIPAEGYTFEGWYEAGEKVSTAKAYAFKITAERILTAKFIPLENSQHEGVETYKISLAPLPVEGGKVYGGGEYTEGEKITIDAVAELDYFFVNWTEDEVEISTDIIYTFVVERDLKLEANFAPLITGTKAGQQGSGKHSFEIFLNTYFVNYFRPEPVLQTSMAKSLYRQTKPGLGLPPMGDGDER